MDFTIQNGEDRIEHCAPLKRDLVIPEPENETTLCVQIRRSPFVRRIFAVMTAIQFDNQFSGSTSKIGNVRANSHLAIEAVAVQLPVPQLVPKEVLGVRRVLAHGAGERLGARVRL